MTSPVIRSCICEVEGGKGWTNQIDHPGVRSKKLLVYDDTRCLSSCRHLPATGSLVALPASPAASPRLSLDSLCRCAPPRCFLKMASASLEQRSPQSRLHSDLASRSAVSQKAPSIIDRAGVEVAEAGTTLVEERL